MQVALAWLLHRAPNILLIPGTSSPAHLSENLAAAKLALSEEVLARLPIGKPLTLVEAEPRYANYGDALLIPIIMWHLPAIRANSTGTG